MADKKNPLPDISGVFHIDESKIPKTIIDKPKETGLPKTTGGILLPDEKPAETWDELIPNFNVVRNALNRQ